ncbi:hypothetical protein BP6252_09308 [Coleophoma cylindrospora]|uniref:Protein SQS1 n=1 Tax=Coleophoma cylindrospora TaxID=1849047 RepID=A0A3D8R1J2_9HELO|nr:hypothetical protein BP6252_09308 [Coleophoma cylindrospora]
MPRTKKPALRGKGRGGPRGGLRNGSDTSFVPFAGTSSPRNGHREYTLQDEARNTERHHSSSSDQKLRFNKVNFISAGPIDPTEPTDTESAMAEMTLSSSGKEFIEVEVDQDDDDFDPTTKANRLSLPSPPSPQEPTKDESIFFIIDEEGGEAVQTGLSPPRLRASSPTPSNSSEEVILFAGRGRGQRVVTMNDDLSRDPVGAIDAKIKMVENELAQKKVLLEQAIRSKSVSQGKPAYPSDIHQSTHLEEAPNGRRNRSQPRRRHYDSQDSIDQAVIADYITNIDEDDSPMLNSSYNLRDLGGADSDVWLDESDGGSAEPPTTSVREEPTEWNRSDICDFDDLSTSDDAIGSVQVVLSKRERNSGTQYLVVWEGQGVDEARWIPATTLEAIGATRQIESFEAEEKLVAEFAEAGDSSSSDSDDTSGDDENSDDDADLMQRKIDRMTDEQIARLLAKQEQLGMGSDELLLFDGEADAEDDGDDFNASKSRFTWSKDKPSNKRAKVKGKKRPRGDFPVATALADAYDGFDIMDFDRPSLKKKPKGRKGKLILDDVSDSELEASMQMAWENDRVKKKERKQEREELREIPYPLMIASSLMKYSLSLPPMDKADRKIVHELANAFKLKSKSLGSGNKRFPVLIRTSKTTVFVEQTFAQVEAKLTRRFLPRMDVGRSSGGSKRGGRGPGGFNSGTVSYRDGDVVGASAPELGIENRGRAMLEKMGWSSGTALGALNNKGILQPVSHVVKTSKAGLG